MYIFGPVTSRRFGISLGVDLSPQQKQCNFDCLYCELKGAKVISKMDYVEPVGKIIEELKTALLENPNLDFITLTANGEPTLYPYLGELVGEIKALHVLPRILILSNGSSITQLDVQNNLMQIDVVKLSLDCATQKSFVKLDRPAKGIHVQSIIEAMAEFSQKFCGELIVEILVVEGINDNEAEFKLLNEALQKIKPSRVDIGTISRPPAYGVKGVNQERLYELSKLITNVAITIPWRPTYKQKLNFSKDELLELLSLRPQSDDDVLSSFSKISQDNLLALQKENLVKEVDVAGVRFYRRG